jgi:hypothetical protein
MYHHKISDLSHNKPRDQSCAPECQERKDLVVNARVESCRFHGQLGVESQRTLEQVQKLLQGSVGVIGEHLQYGHGDDV